MVPAIQRLLDDNESKAAKFFNATIGMAYVMNTSDGGDMHGLWEELASLDPAETDKTGFVSPLIQVVYKSGEKLSSLEMAPQLSRKDGLIFTSEALNQAPTCVNLMFYWTSFEAVEEFEARGYK